MNSRSYESLSDVVGRRVREARTRRGWTAAQVARRCAELGVPELTAQAVFNLESGRRDATGRRRRAVTVDELLALAAALNCAPLHLLVPIDDDETAYSVAPVMQVSASAARSWICGASPLPGADPRAYFTEVPRSDFEAAREASRSELPGMAADFVPAPPKEERADILKARGKEPGDG